MDDDVDDDDDDDDDDEDMGSIQIYFFAALAYDVIEPWKGPELLRHIQRGLRMFKAVFFTSVVIPTAILVAVNYWTLNTLLDPALIEDTQVLQRYVPLWMDHTLHTAVVPFAILELLLAHRPYPRWKTLGRLRSTFVVLSYTSWVVFCVLVGGAWPYPYLQRMTVAQRLIYLLINCALAAWSYSASDVINAAVWGTRCKVV